MVVGMVIWMLARPLLDTAITGLAQTVIRAYEYPRVTRLVVADSQAQVRRSDFRSDSQIPAVPLTEISFNTIVLLALYLALPKPLSRKQLEQLFMGCCVLLLTQSINLVFHVKTLYALGLGEWSQQHYSDAARNAYGFFRYFTDLPGRFSFPFLIWMGFNWHQVMLLINQSGARPSAKPLRAKGKRLSPKR
jgi:hypothetical protein